MPSRAIPEPIRYGGRADLPQFLAFATASTAARAPLRALWHPGDLAWQLRGRYDAPQALYGFADEAGGLAAIARFQAPGELLLEVMPARDAMTAPLLDWAVEKARRAPPAVRAPALRLTVFERDEARREAAAAAGFAPAGPAGVHFERALTDQTSDPAPPPGVRLRDCVGIDPEGRAEVHRAAWSALGHLGIEGASTFSAALYDSLETSGVYDAALDMVAEAEDGTLVANCIAWADPVSGVGTFEPVGVHPDFRGRGLAGAVMMAAMRRLSGAGHQVARVGTAHFNAAAIASYAKSFELVDRSGNWERPIAAPD